MATTTPVVGPTVPQQNQGGAARAATAPARSSAIRTVGLVGLRLAIGFEFLWAFFDKLFGWGYHTASAKAWIHGGSPTTGFLKGAGGPFKSTFHSMAGVGALDWLFMAGLLGIGVALILGVALRVAAASGGLLLLMMYLASWPFATIADGQPTGSTNPIVDDHVVSIFGLIVIATCAATGAGFFGYLGRRWAALPVVRRQPWLT